MIYSSLSHSSWPCRQLPLNFHLRQTFVHLSRHQDARRACSKVHILRTVSRLSHCFFRIKNRAPAAIQVSQLVQMYWYGANDGTIDYSGTAIARGTQQLEGITWNRYWRMRRPKNDKRQHFARQSRELRILKNSMSTEVVNGRSLKKGLGGPGEACTPIFFSLTALFYNYICRKEWLQYANWEVGVWVLYTIHISWSIPFDT